MIDPAESCVIDRWQALDHVSVAVQGLNKRGEIFVHEEEKR